jgi:hypothetical protein
VFRADEHAKSIMAGMPAPAPIPRGPIMARMAVTQLDDVLWNEADQKCRRDMPEFFEPYHRSNPTHPNRLYEASECIRQFIWRIESHFEWANFRDQIRRMVDRMNGVKTMVCLGLGQYVGPVWFENVWIVQYAVFAYMWKVINRKWQNECAQRGDPPTLVQRFFQDPVIDKRTRYLLERIPRNNDPGQNIVVENLGALDIILADTNTFVFAPHLPCRSSVSILSCRPKVYIGNSRKGPGGWTAAMVEEYMEECKFEGLTVVGQRVNDLWTRIRVADANYNESLLVVQANGAGQSLGDLSIYERRD